MAKRVHPPSPGIGSDVAGPVAFLASDDAS